MITARRALERLCIKLPSEKQEKVAPEIGVFIEPREGDRFMRCGECWYYIGHEAPELKEVDECNLPQFLLAIDTSLQPASTHDSEDIGTPDDEDEDSCSCIPRGNKVYSVAWSICGPDPSRPSPSAMGPLGDWPREFVLYRWGLIRRKAQSVLAEDRPASDLSLTVEMDAMTTLFRELDRLQAGVDGHRRMSDGYRGDMTIAYMSGKVVKLDRESTTGDRSAFGCVWDFLVRECPEIMGVRD